MKIKETDVISEIVQVITGTAGHVDHGKTSLVKALTGCDTDRLPEEKRRHLSIDLGFAPCRLPGNRIVGIVDVPGHEDFIRNMIAGAASIDILMLVIAADDGVMPQTMEHLRIVSLLRRPQVMVVLSKIDLVDEVIRETVILEIREFLEHMGFSAAPVVPFSAATGDGIQDIRRVLNNLVSNVSYEPDTRAFRMNIERVFSIKGHGTVVTGIPISGHTSVGEPIELFPSGKKCIVRAIEAYKQDVTIAPAHSCAAINLRDIEAEMLERGMTIASPGKYQITQSVIAHLRNTTDSLSLKRIQDAWLLAGTSKIRATVRLMGSDSLQPGKEIPVQIRLSEPLVLAAGDRYVIRLLNPPVTFGGGEILSTSTYGRKKPSSNFALHLEEAHRTLNEGNLVFAELLAGPYTILSKGRLAALSHMNEDESGNLAAELLSMGQLVELGAGIFMVKEKFPAIIDMLAGSIAQYHRTHPYSRGIEYSMLCKLLGIETRSLPGLDELLAASGRIALRQGRYAIPDFKPSIKSLDIDLKERILAFVYEGNINGQARGDIMKKFSLTETRFKLYANMLTEECSVKSFGNHFMHHVYFEQVREKILAHFEKNEKLEIAELRDLLKSGRHFAVDLLEAFDAEGMTRRLKEGRVLAKKWKMRG